MAALDPTPTPAPVPADTVSPEVIERIRKEEKDKLYSEITDLRTRLDAALAAQSEAGTKTEEYTRKITDLTEQLSALQKAAKANFDPTTFAREISAETRQLMSEEHTRKVQELNDRLTRLEKEKAEATLAAIRTKLIADAGGKIVAAMVRGTTEAELIASAEEAKQEYARIIASGTPTTAPTPTPAPVPSPTPGTQPIPIVNTGRGSNADWAKTRQQTLAAIRAQHG